MSALGSFFHQVGKALGHPSEEEAGHLSIVLAEDVQQLGEVLFHARGQAGPLVDGGHTGIIQDMEPVFNVNRENGGLHEACG